ncbi:MAG TPA: RDD family protein, partial [Steroidobacteraceae bacterium]|nr:RDD family protein [Steroidobacteraceae bacterium]
FRGGVERCVQTLEERPGQSFLAALLTMLLTPVAFVLLCITVLGIAAVPFLALALLCAGFFGKVVVLTTLGRRCGSFLTPGETLNPAIAVIIGGALVLLLYTVPIVGFITYKLLGILGLGVVVYTLLLAFKASRQPHGTVGAGGPGAAGGLGAAGGGGSGAGGGAAGAGSQTYSSVNATANLGPQSGATASGSGTAPGSGADASAGASYGTASGYDFVASAGSGPMGGARSQSGTASGAASAAGPEPAAGAASGSAAGPGAAAGTAAGTATLSVAERLALPRAGFWIRIGALLLDALLIGILVHTGHEGFDVSLLLLAAYGAFMWKFKGTTVGGIICGLQVVRLDGREIDWATAIVRALSCFLSLAVVGLGFIWIAIDDEHQGWHDKIAGTVVVRSPKGHSLL